MITLYGLKGGALAPIGDDIGRLSEAVWIDIDNPDRDEKRTLLERMGLTPPAAHEMRSGLVATGYRSDDETVVFCPRLLAGEGPDQYVDDSVAFIIRADRLITVRHATPVAFTLLRERIERGDVFRLSGGAEVFFQLMEVASDDYGTKLASVGDELNAIAREVLRDDLDGSPADLHKDQVNRLSAAEYLNGRIMNSLMTLTIMGDDLEMLKQLGHQAERHHLGARIRSLQASGSFVSDRIDFVLNAVTSVITLEQNRVLNVFSVFTVVITPPTLLAAIWGMNFRYMPELSWPWGYLFAWVCIIASGVLPFTYVRRKGWL